MSICRQVCPWNTLYGCKKPDNEPCILSNMPCAGFEKKQTNADHIRAMSDEELADLLCTADWCETCDQMREEGTCKAMELDGPLSKHCVSAALRWLQQPYKEDT